MIEPWGGSRPPTQPVYLGRLERELHRTPSHSSDDNDIDAGTDKEGNALAISAGAWAPPMAAGASTTCTGSGEWASTAKHIASAQQRWAS